MVVREDCTIFVLSSNTTNMKYIYNFLAIVMVIVASPLIIVYTLHTIALRVSKTITDDTTANTKTAEGSWHTGPPI